MNKAHRPSFEDAVPPGNTALLRSPVPPNQAFSGESGPSSVSPATMHGLDCECGALLRSHQLLKESLGRHLDLYELAPVGYITLNQQGLILEINLAASALLGKARESLSGQPLSRFLLPEDQPVFESRRTESCRTHTQQSWEMRMLRNDGSTFWARFQAIPERNGEFWVILNDITELLNSRQEMLKAQKLESLGVLAGGIAHDFNNILTAILGNISLARLQLLDPAKVAKRLDEAEAATTRAKALTRQLITFALGGEPVKQVIDIGALLRESTGFALHGSSVKCEYTIADGIWAVEADDGQLRQVIHNLVFNAVQSMPDGGTLRITADNITSELEQKKFVRISITDTGVGIPAHHMLQIFDPYFSTKQNCNGLGLATCHSILKKHGGKIRALSTLGQGSTFYVSLPAVEPVVDQEPHPEAPPSEAGKHLLLMDDEQIIRELVEAILTEFEYSVECVENGADAVELYRKRKEQGTPFSAVILDLTIPGGVGGRETIEKLRAIDPDVKAIVSSGYSDDPVVAHFRDYGFGAVLCKPYRPQEMNRVLKELLAT
jgi:PAS domain S-box-containing protein